MAGFKTALIYCFLFVSLPFLSEVTAKSYRSSSSNRHSYPSSHGYSGHKVQSSHHGYPSSSGLSGHSSSHQAISVAGSHSYPSSAGTLSGSHSYPASNSLSGSGGLKPSVSYPASSGLSGGGASHLGGTSYPASSGLSGNSQSARYPAVSSYPQHHPQPSYTQNHYPTSNIHNTHEVHHHTNTHTVVHHHHYDYRPPTVIHYTPSYGMGPVSYPVYTGHVPTYVYEYRSSANKYRHLLAGLALFNLGMIASNPTMHHYHKHYTPEPNEFCRFGVQYQVGTFDEMAIDCRTITNFIWTEQSKPQTVHIVNQTVVTTSVQTQNVLSNGTPGQPQPLSNTGVVTGVAPVSTSVITNTTTVTTISDPKYRGSPVDVTSGMQCYVSRTTAFSNMRKEVPCGLLRSYADQSLRRSSAVIVRSSLIVLVAAVGVMFV